MALISMRQMLDHAAEFGYGVPAFNVNNLEQIHAIMEAAEETDSPVILQASAGARKYAGEPYLRHMVLAAAVKARLGGVGTLPGGLAIADQHVASDLSAEQVLTYAAAFFRLDPTAVSQHVVKGPFGTSPDGQSIVMLGDESRAVLAQFASGRL